MSLLDSVFRDLTSTLFDVRVGKDGKKKGTLKQPYTTSTLTYPEWQDLSHRLFCRPGRDFLDQRTVWCGRTLVVTLSARPSTDDPAESWDAAQFACLRDCVRIVCARNQYQQVAALAKTAVEARKLDQVGGRGVRWGGGRGHLRHNH